MSGGTPLSTPIRQAKLATSKSLPLVNEYKRLLSEQHQRLWMKHQQDLDLIDDIRTYVKARLSIERDYTSSLLKLTKQHSQHIAKKFSLLNQCDPTAGASGSQSTEHGGQHDSEVSDSRLQKRLANRDGMEAPEGPCTLYKVWWEHINRLQSSTKNRADQFEQLLMVVDKLKDIRSHKAAIGKKCLDTHLKRIHEDVVLSMVDLEKARKLYYEDESQAKKARENEEKIKKKRSGLLTKFTDLQAKKEKTSAQREANDIQSTQARNDYIMALAAVNAHLQHYYQRDLNDFIQLIDDGVLDHCKIFMATISECDINSLKDSLSHAQYWSKMINLTGTQATNSLFLDCAQSGCLRQSTCLAFEPCNQDPIHTISLEHNADYALQHEIDKWFTWFKKECRNLSQLLHQLETCQRAFAEGKRSIDLNGQSEELEPKIIELKQQIRKCEAAKLKAQARLKVIKEGGMQIEEWSAVESEIRADMARTQAELESKRLHDQQASGGGGGQQRHSAASSSDAIGAMGQRSSSYLLTGDPSQAQDSGQQQQIKLRVSRDSDDDSNGPTNQDASMHNLASVSRSPSAMNQQQQQPSYQALTDPTLVWQDDYSSAWGRSQVDLGGGAGGQSVVVTQDGGNDTKSQQQQQMDLLDASQHAPSGQQQTSMTVQSSSPLSAIMDGLQSSPSPYQGMQAEAYKSDYECDYNRNGVMRSTASSADTYGQRQMAQHQQVDLFGQPIEESMDQQQQHPREHSVEQMLNQRVVGLYAFDATNEDDLAFNEGDVMLVVEVNDENWVKARHEATGEAGFVPVSYLSLIATDAASGKGVEVEEDELAWPQAALPNESNELESGGDWNTQDLLQREQQEQPSYCRALYDYQPEADTYEEDGLPHLAVVAGELMRIIEQGEDDGWWLVEKEDEHRVRGHVPSMLLEEVAADEQEELEDEEVEEEEVGSFDEPPPPDMEAPLAVMPTFAPPTLQEDSGSMEEPTIKDNNNNNFGTKSFNNSNNNNLIATSFIITEPTPGVDGRRLEESLGDRGNANASNIAAVATADDVPTANITNTTTRPPASDTSYSVVNEEFVLEGPTRKPYSHHQQPVQHHETPTILEEDVASTPEAQTNLAYSINNSNLNNLDKTNNNSYEPLSEVESLEMATPPPPPPPPPEVVIDSCEDRRRDQSLSEDGDGGGGDDDRSSLDGASDSDQTTPVYVQKEIKHTGNVDVSPLLRMRAEEFSKKIIAEALMLVPGARVGPSTSTANTNDDDDDNNNFNY